MVIPDCWSQRPGLGFLSLSQELWHIMKLRRSAAWRAPPTSLGGHYGMLTDMLTYDRSQAGQEHSRATALLRVRDQSHQHQCLVIRTCVEHQILAPQHTLCQCWDNKNNDLKRKPRSTDPKVFRKVETLNEIPVLYHERLHKNQPVASTYTYSSLIVLTTRIPRITSF